MRSDLSIKLTAGQCSALGPWLDQACREVIEEVKEAKIRADPHERDSIYHATISSKFVDRIRKSETDDERPRQRTLVFSRVFSFDRNTEDEAQVLRRALIIALAHQPLLTETTRTALGERLGRVDEWLRTPIIDRIASLDDPEDPFEALRRLHAEKRRRRKHA